MGNDFTYAIRGLVRENAIAARRASELVASERIAPAELERRQDALLRRSLEAAAERLPAYAGLRGRIPASGLREFLREAVPVHGKEELLAQRERYYPNGGRARWWWSVGRTSGSTGTPLEVFRSVDSAVWEHAFHLQHWRWAGLRPGEWQVVLRGDPVVPLERQDPPFWYADRIGRQLVVSLRHLTPRAAGPIGQAIRACGAMQLRAYPSAAGVLAQFNDELRLGLRFRSIVTSSEMLYPLQRERIEASFGARVFDFYGMAERNALALQCEHGALHVHPGYSMVEIVDADGRPTEGEGHVAGTTLRNLTMPLLRYRLGDTARWARQACRCGRSYPVIENLSGKVEEQVFDLDGRAVSPSLITFAFKGVAHIARAQVAQVAADAWEVRVVPGPGWCEADARALRQNFEQQVSRRLALRVQTVAAIPNLASGKYKWVTQEWRV